MKRKVIFTCTLCFLLCVCGCTPRTAGEIRRTDEESQADANAAGVVQGDSLKTPVENEATEWPTAEEIRTTIAVEQTEVYWLANAIQIPEQMNCYTVDALDMEMFWDTLKEKLQNGKGAIESGTLSIFNGAEQIQPVLEELSRVTGTAFVEVSVWMAVYLSHISCAALLFPSLRWQTAGDLYGCFPQHLPYLCKSICTERGSFWYGGSRWRLPAFYNHLRYME